MSGAKVLVFFAVAIIFAGVAIFYLVKTHIPDATQMVSDLKKQAEDSFISPPVAPEATNLTEQGSEVPFAVEAGDAQLLLTVKGKTFVFDRPEDKRRWIGILVDPYSQLKTLSGTPFFTAVGNSWAPGENILPLLNHNQSFTADTDSFKPFSFFSKDKTTIGVIEGMYDLKTYESHLKLTFIDLGTGASVVIATDEMAFPTWYTKGGLPPSYSTQKYVYPINPTRAYGANVYDAVKKFSDGGYHVADDVLKALQEKELKDARLTDTEKQLLKKAAIDNTDFKNDFLVAIQKMTRFFYYSKQLHKSEEAKALLQAVSPSIRSGVINNRELKPE